MPLLTLFPNLDIRLPASELTEPQRLLFDILLYLLLSQNTIFARAKKVEMGNGVLLYCCIDCCVFYIEKR